MLMLLVLRRQGDAALLDLDAPTTLGFGCNVAPDASVAGGPAETSRGAELATGHDGEGSGFDPAGDVRSAARQDGRGRRVRQGGRRPVRVLPEGSSLGELVHNLRVVVRGRCAGVLGGPAAVVVVVVDVVVVVVDEVRSRPPSAIY